MTDGRADQAAIDRVAAALVEHRAGYAFTGAGVSVESGIPDFRSAGGIWDRYDPMRYATIQAFKRDPEGVWEFFRELERTLESPSPNPAHKGLARLEALGLIEGIATQNIDGLHQRAGSQNVIELHGSHRQLECLACGATSPRSSHDEVIAAGRLPRCPCGGVLKPSVILFGEPLPPGAIQRAIAHADGARAMLVVGTSAEVYPAAHVPHATKGAGGRVFEINLTPTALTQGVASETLLGPAGDTIPRLVDACERLVR